MGVVKHKNKTLKLENDTKFKSSISMDIIGA